MYVSKFRPYIIACPHQDTNQGGERVSKNCRIFPLQVTFETKRFAWPSMSLLFLRGNHNSGWSPSVYNPCCLPFLSCKTTWPIGSRMRINRHAKKGATVQPGRRRHEEPYSRAGTTRKDLLEPLVSDAPPPPRTGRASSAATGNL